MQSEKCTKCNNDLPFAVSGEAITCSFCGAIYEIDSKLPDAEQVNTEAKKSLSKKSSTDTATIAAISTILGS